MNTNRKDIQSAVWYIKPPLIQYFEEYQYQVFRYEVRILNLLSGIKKEIAINHFLTAQIDLYIFLKRHLTILTLNIFTAILPAISLTD